MNIEKRILITGTSGCVGNKLLKTVKGAIAAPSIRNASKEEINLKRQEINDLFNKINELMSESQHNLL